MLINNQNDLFHGCDELIKEQVSQLSSLLELHNDAHTVHSCLSAMAHIARLDLAMSLSMADDIEGLSDFLGDSIVHNEEIATRFIKLACEGISNDY